MPIQIAFVELDCNKFGPPEHCAVQALIDRGIPYLDATVKSVSRHFSITPDTLVIGSIPFVHGALHKMGLPTPEPDDYPSVLQEHFHRRIWPTKMRVVESQACFVKPRKKLKRFTGRVMYGYDPFLVNYASLNTEVWASEIVKFVSEWRCFVVRGDLVGVRHYDGDVDVPLDLETVQEAILALGSPPDGYALDFGVLDTGETALVEMNAGYSIDPYGLEPELYLQVLEAWWESTTRHLRGSEPMFTP